MRYYKATKGASTKFFKQYIKLSKLKNPELTNYQILAPLIFDESTHYMRSFIQEFYSNVKLIDTEEYIRENKNRIKISFKKIMGKSYSDIVKLSVDTRTILNWLIVSSQDDNCNPDMYAGITFFWDLV